MKAVQTFLLLLSLLLFSAAHLFLESQPGTNGCSTGFYHLRMKVQFPSAQDPPKGRHHALLVSCGTYGFSRLFA